MHQIIPNISAHFIPQDKGIYLNSLLIEHNNNFYHLRGRTTDTIHIFQQSICLHVLTINQTAEYLSLHSYMQPEPDPINSIILQGTHEIKQTLGHRWEQLTPFGIVTKLLNCLEG